MYIYSNMWKKNDWYYFYIAIHETISCAQKRAHAHLRMLSTKCVYKSYIFNIYV